MLTEAVYQLLISEAQNNLEQLHNTPKFEIYVFI